MSLPGCLRTGSYSLMLKPACWEGSGPQPGLSVQAGNNIWRRQNLACPSLPGSSSHSFHNSATSCPILELQGQPAYGIGMSHRAPHNCLKPSKDLYTESPDSQSNDFSAHCVTKKKKKKNPTPRRTFGNCLLCLYPEVERTLSC